MPTFCIILAHCLCNTHRSGIYVIPSRRGRNLIVLRAKVRMAEGHPKPDEGGFVHSPRASDQRERRPGEGRQSPRRAVSAKVLVEGNALAKRNVAVLHRPPGALPPFQTFALTARCERTPLPRASLPTVACRRAMNSPSCGGRGMAFSHPAPQTAL